MGGSWKGWDEETASAESVDVMSKLSASGQVPPARCLDGTSARRRFGAARKRPTASLSQ